jgi:hypothetical protein
VPLITSQAPPSGKICNCSFKNLQEEAPANQGWTGCDKMTYFFKEIKPNIVNSWFITGSYRICQKLRDLKAFQVTFKQFCHPGLPGVLRHSAKLRILPQDTQLRERVEKSCWTSLAWWRRLHNSVGLWQCVIFRIEVGSHHCVRVSKTNKSCLVCPLLSI